MEINRNPPGFLSLVILLFVAAFGCVGSILVAADFQCRSDIETWAPLYPNAETVSVQYDFVRPRALGTTIMIQHSSDDVEVVKQHFRDLNISNLRGNKMRGLAATDVRVELDEESGMSRIMYYSACGI